jgi:hypothetical protein
LSLKWRQLKLIGQRKDNIKMQADYIALPQELDFKINGEQVVGYVYDERFNTVYFFSERAMLIKKEKVYGYYKQSPLDFSGKKLKKRFGDR